MEQGGGLLVDLNKSLALLGPRHLPGGEMLLRQFDLVFGGQLLDRLGKGEVVVLHDKGKDIAALTAAEAVIGASFRVDHEGGGFFGVEGADAFEVYTTALEGYNLADHRRDIGGFLDPLDNMVAGSCRRHYCSCPRERCDLKFQPFTLFAKENRSLKSVPDPARVSRKKLILTRG